MTSTGQMTSTAVANRDAQNTRTPQQPQTLREALELLPQYSTLRDVIQLVRTFMPPATRSGENAGTRSHEGVAFREAMRSLLNSAGHLDSLYVFEAATGKSSNGRTLDGNASERLSHKMLNFVVNPLEEDRKLVLCLNAAFELYDSPLGVLRMHATYLNGMARNSRIIILATEQDYDAFLQKHTTLLHPKTTVERDRLLALL